MNSLIILDRDGVINQDSKEFIKSPDEWHALPGSLEAICALNQHGIKVAIATNQSGIARSLFSSTMLTAIHTKLRTQLQALGGHIDGIYFCPHGPNDDCSCRKPKPGLMLNILKDFNIQDPSAIWAVGDSLRDLQAAKAANVKPVLVRTGNGVSTEQSLTPDLIDTPIFADLHAFVQHVVR